MNKIFTLILLFVSLKSFSQSIQSITDKVSEKICDCMNNKMESYSEIKPEFNKCYDKEFNQIFSIVDSNEQKILVQNGALEQIKNRIIPTLNENCEKVKKIIDSELNNSIEPAFSNSKKAFPINFTLKDFKKLNKFENKIIALEGDVIQVEVSSKKTPYTKLRIGDEEIWAVSMFDSGLEIVGNKIKIVGYLIALKNSDYERKFNKDNYQILAFGLLDVNTNELKYFPGSEMQMKEWKNGQIPSDGN